jgi:hypothetical protein
MILFGAKKSQTFQQQELEREREKQNFQGEMPLLYMQLTAVACDHQTD